MGDNRLQGIRANGNVKNGFYLGTGLLATTIRLMAVTIPVNAASSNEMIISTYSPDFSELPLFISTCNAADNHL